LLQAKGQPMAMRMLWMVVVAMIGAAMWPCGASAAEIAGMWVAEVSGPTLLEPVYAHVTLESTGDTVTGTWERNTVKGSLNGSQVMLTLMDAEGATAGELTGKLEGAEGAGSGTLAGLGRRPGGAGAGGRAPVPQDVTWKLTREVTPPSKPREINYEPKTFQAYYYAGNKPDIHIFPGDIVLPGWSTPQALIKTGSAWRLAGTRILDRSMLKVRSPAIAGCSPDIRLNRTARLRGREAEFSSLE
jgi:amidase